MSPLRPHDADVGRKIVTIDCSAGSYVARCELHPNFRGATHAEKVWAMADADRHRRLEHPEAARDTAKKRRRRGSLITAAR